MNLIILAINWTCILPMLAWLLGAFLLGWLLKHLFGGGNKNIERDYNALTIEHNDFTNKYKLLEQKHHDLNLSVNKLQADADGYSAAQVALNNLKRELETVKEKKDELFNALEAERKKVGNTTEKIVEKIVEVPASRDQLYNIVSGFFGAKIVQDDLKLVEGIGPKIEELFHQAGLNTWASVASSTPERLKEILTEGGDRFLMHDPGTWPRQQNP